MAAPGLRGGVRALADEPVLHRDERVRRALAPGDLHVRSDVREDRDVHVAEHAGLDEVRFRAVELLGDAGPELERAGQMLLLHDLLDRERRSDLKRHPGVVAFAVAGSAFDDRIVIGDAGLLRRLRDVVDIRSERDDRLPGSPRREPGGGNACVALLNREAVLAKDAGQVLRRLEFLEPRLGEAEDLIVHALDHLAESVDFEADVALEAIEARIARQVSRTAGRSAAWRWTTTTGSRQRRQ